MKISQILFAIMALFFFANTSFAQSTKTEVKAAEKVEQINQAITSIDKSLALTSEQTEKIMALQIQNLEDRNALKESNASKKDKKAQKKELNKAFKNEVSNNILSKEQKKAQKKAKGAKKAAKE